MTTPSDTLVLDTTLIAKWKADGVDFDQEFATENRPQKTHTTEPDSSWDLGWLKSLFGESNSARTLVGIILLVAVCVTLIFMLRKQFDEPEKRVTLDPDEEDTIYGVDFAAALKSAEDEQNYVQCIRLRYLQLLRLLHDQHKIFWLPGKTTTQYVDEANMAPFAALTKIFVRVRYGKYPADAALYAECKTLAAEVDSLVGGNQRKEAEA